MDKLLEEEPDDNEDDDLLLARAAALLRRSKSFPELKNEAARIKAVEAASEEVAAAAAAAAAEASTPAATLKVPTKTAGSRGREAAKRKHRRKKVLTLEALSIAGTEDGADSALARLQRDETPVLLDSYDAELLEASQQDFMYAGFPWPLARRTDG